MKTPIAVLACAVALCAQNPGTPELKHLSAPIASSAKPLAVAATEIERAAQYPSVVHLRGAVEIRMPVCVVTGGRNAQSCGGYITLHADDAVLHEDTGEIETTGKATITRN